MAAMIPPLDAIPGASASPVASPSPNQGAPPLAPIVTSPPSRRSVLARPTSHASKHRLSQYSNHSAHSRSRPPSHLFPIFHSSLPYTLVRDFAYPPSNAMHYGPLPEPSRPPSALSTPASEPQDRFYDPPTSWDSRDSWGSGEQLPAVQYADGPPWSEDEDLQSPVVTVNRHRKHKTSPGSEHGRGRGRNRRGDEERPSSLLGQGSRDGERAYNSELSDGNNSQGHDGGDLLTYPPEQGRQPGHLAPYNTAGQRDSHFATMLPSRTYTDETGQGYVSESDSSASSPGMPRRDESRYSRDYQFTIASPDEEMHGKAVALFDFARENENELPLVEGQVIWVSYRHGQGWLVAMDPKTEESGLVPEEYVRMLRDIQGGLNSLSGNDQLLSPGDSGTPTQAQHSQSFDHSSTPSNGYQQPVVSMFSTSSKDLNPYPQHLLGTQAGQAPPQVIHYHGQRGGSQANTPTVSTSQEGESKARTTDEGSATTPIAGSLPDTKLGATTAAHPESPTSPDSDSTEEGGTPVGER